MIQPCEIYLDTSGVKVQTGKLMNNQSLKIQNGQTLSILINEDFEGTSEEIGCSYKDLVRDVYPGMEIEIGNSGSLHCKVKAIFEDRVQVECLNDFELGEDQTIHIPGARKVQKEEQDTINASIFDLCTKYPVDKVGLSFVNDA